MVVAKFRVIANERIITRKEAVKNLPAGNYINTKFDMIVLTKEVIVTK
jgi:hypothetical protein